MTELIEPDESAAAQPSTEWPAPDGTGLATGAGVNDRTVAEAIKRLESLPHLPVGDQEAAYNQLHDDLLAALNADPADVADPADLAAPADAAASIVDGGA